MLGSRGLGSERLRLGLGGFRTEENAVAFCFWGFLQGLKEVFKKKIRAGERSAEWPSFVSVRQQGIDCGTQTRGTPCVVSIASVSLPPNYTCTA